jgi:hypothetical protein
LHTELRDAWGQWVAEMGEWHIFGALTYDPGKHPVKPGADVVRAHARRWLRQGARAIGRPIEAGILALEYQKNGYPHLHPLLRLSGGLRPTDLPALGQLWWKPHGLERLEYPRKQEDVCAYATKYLTKDLAKGDVIFWPTRGQLTTHQPALLNPGKRG